MEKTKKEYHDGYKVKGKIYCEKCVRDLKNVAITVLEFGDKDFPLTEYFCTVCKKEVASTLTF